MSGARVRAGLVIVAVMLAAIAAVLPMINYQGQLTNDICDYGIPGLINHDCA